MSRIIARIARTVKKREAMIIDQEIDKRLLILKVIWFAMLMSLVTYLFVGLYAAANVGPLMKEDTVGMLRPFFLPGIIHHLHCYQVYPKAFFSGKRSI